MRLEDSRVIAPTAGQRRDAARTLLQMGAGDGLLAFHVVDTHAHAVLACSRARAGQLARRVEIALRARLRLPCRFEPARIRPVLDQWHLQRSVLYVIRQEERHGICVDPARDGCSLPDVLGWRVADETLAARLRSLVPRVRLAAPADASTLAGVEPDPELLAEAAAAALALVDLDGRSAATVHGRRAAVWAGAAEALRGAAVASALAITRRRVAQLLAEPPPPPAWIRAVRTQLRFRTWLARGIVASSELSSRALAGAMEDPK
ncbi:MAG: hypothetical protein WKG00_40995 [Polyangiaceae bacterium]